MHVPHCSVKSGVVSCGKERCTSAVLAAGTALGEEIAVCVFVSSPEQCWVQGITKVFFCQQNAVTLCTSVLLDNSTSRRVAGVSSGIFKIYVGCGSYSRISKS